MALITSVYRHASRRKDYDAAEISATDLGAAESAFSILRYVQGVVMIALQSGQVQADVPSRNT